MQTEVSVSHAARPHQHQAVVAVALASLRPVRRARPRRPALAALDRTPAQDVRDPAHPDAQFLQALVRGASRTPPSPDVGHLLLKRFGSLEAVMAAPYDEIASLGILPHSVIEQLGQVYAAARRMARAKVEDRPIDSHGTRFLDYLVAAMSHETRQQVRLFALDARGRLIAETITATGTTDHVHVYPREVMGAALAQNAHSIVVAHNHPSGDPTPSAAERQMVETLRRGAEVLSIQLDDYIVVGNGRCFSFRAHGLLGARPA